MTKSLFAFAAALALPLSTPLFAQAPADIELDRYPPLSGSWSYRPISGGSEASFTGTEGLRLVIRCNRANRSVSIIRTAIAAAAPTLSVWTSTASRSVPASYKTTRELTATLAATDSLLDAIAFSRSRFATAGQGVPMLTVPANPEPARVVEDCRS